MFDKEGFDYRVALYRVGIRMTRTILNLKPKTAFGHMTSSCWVHGDKSGTCKPTIIWGNQDLDLQNASVHNDSEHTFYGIVRPKP